MKTEFKTDINGLYLEITPENDNERRLMGELMSDPLRGKRVKMGLRPSTDQRGTQVVRIQAFRYLSNILELSSRITIKNVAIQNGIVIQVDKLRYYVIKSRQPDASPVGTVMGTVKVWELLEFTGASGTTLDFVKDPNWAWRSNTNATGGLRWLGICQTENEFLTALGIK